jgi:CO/xanthine dehydrogenase FAD-binding subunit
MKPPAFRYAAPTTVREVVALLAQHGGDARVIAGGQSLVPLMNLRIIRPAVLIDLNRCAELNYIEHRDGYLAFGPMVRQLDAHRSAVVRALCPLVADALEWTGPVAVRARSTVGGTLAHADRVAELPAVAIALEAVMVIEGEGGRREVDAADFFLGDLSTVIEPGEFLREVRFPVTAAHAYTGFSEVGVRQEGVAVVGLAAYLERDPEQVHRVAKVALAAMGVDAAPVRLRAAEAVLLRRGLRADAKQAIEEACEAACGEIAPMADIYTSAAYRKHAVAALLRKTLRAAAGIAVEEETP